MNKSFLSLCKIIKEQWRIITIITLTIILLSEIFILFNLNLGYEASAKLFIGKEKVTNTSKEYNNDEVQLYQRVIKTYSEYIKSKDLILEVLDEADVDVNLKTASKNISVNPIKDTQILEIKYKGKTEQEAYSVAYYLTKNFVENSQKLYKNSNVIVLQQAIVNNEASTKEKYVLISIVSILSLLIAIMCVFVKERLNNTFADKDSVEKFLDIVVLGSIPIQE